MPPAATAAHPASLPRRPRWASLVLLALLLLPLLWPLQQLAENYFRARLGERNQQTLDLYVATLNGTLQRYESLPGLLGGLPALRLALAEPGNPQLRERANQLLAQVRAQTGAEVIYLMDADGLTLASSNAGQADDFSGRNFAFRPYFRDAMAGQRGRFFGLGTTSQQRGYYFADAIREAGRARGVLVVKIDLDDSETLWGHSAEQFLVSDARGVVILTSEPAWRFRALRPLSQADRREIARDRPYPSLDPQPLRLPPEQWLEHSRQLADSGWTVSILAPRSLLDRPVQTTLYIGAASLLVLLLLLGLLLQRRRHYLERIAVDARTRIELEARVQERTQDLQTLNDRLKQEVLEREQAQQELVRTQDDLLQAGKLSALGTMAASISHELNQPLGAIRSYADNASVLLDHGRLDETRDNLRLIGELTTRMASIIAHLRAFARRDHHAPESVALQPALDDALALQAKRRRALEVELLIDLPEAPLWVQAGETRLRQVLANLLGNALDALAGRAPPRRLWLTSTVDAEGVNLSLRDNGPGFSAEALHRAREPFFTSKTNAEGLGLGLAICDSLVDAFGGSLTLANHPQGGALITLHLRHAPGATRAPSAEDLPT
ncbi:sensor histidine kinase [Pseudomonas sp. N040]|uniref:sensor histidine kinase n=1 Tax=Pseudomonas sp. N040 TaxID=2785325 RepID=UPI0018A30AB4|nr:ATP-binding protein [Pseudomonas sp. N040]MBF7731269.1 sensor histidine kinase [Pseudomonas sp. N040]MBW7014912.1 sensor histidine kinase [Pseudomonas sp. N040]